MNVLTSNILSYAFLQWFVLKKTTYATYTYFTGNKIVTGDQIAEQQQTINELNDQVKTLTEYIVDNNILQVDKSIDLNEFDVVNEDSIVRL